MFGDREILHKILQELRKTRIGEHYQQNLEILPLQRILTLNQLRKEDLTQLRHGAQQFNRLADVSVDKFFGPRGQDRIHCIVWLPPKDRQFCFFAFDTVTDLAFFRAISTKSCQMALK